MLERFFDETGGMQLVVHSPFGGRINRALGLALRKKFCRTFNFELQAAASDDAIVLSLGPAPQLPARGGARATCSSATVDDTLEQAILDSPMFQARWRWNLNRSLMVLRFRSGRRNPPPIQRMESDDLMAAVFPQAAACQENVTGPIEIPDHLLVRQTIDDTLHEALDVDGLARAARADRGGRRCGCTAADTTEPSVLAHEILTARPYAFLDDEELQNRRTNAVHAAARAAPSTSPPSARSTRRPSTQVHDEITPDPESADDLHDLLSSLVVVRPAPRLAGAVRPSCADAVGRAVVLEHRGMRAVVHDRARRRRRPSAFAGDDDAVGREPCAVTSRSAGITTVDELAAVDHARRPARVALGLAALEQEGFALQGRYTASGGRAPSGWRAGCWPGCTPTPAATRRGGVRAGDRPGLHALPAALAARRARHPARPARRACSPWSSSSRASRPPPWRGSPSCSAARLRRYEPGVARPAVPRRRGRPGCG